MVLPELIIAIVLVIISILLVGIFFTKIRSGVAFNDEWISTKNVVKKTDRKRNLTIGFIVSFGVVYFLTGRLLLAVIAIPGGFLIANYLSNKKENQRKELLEEQYTQILNTIVTSLQGGANPYQAIEETVTSLKNPAKDIFVEILRRTRTSVGYSEAIGSVAQEIEWEDLKQLEMAFRLYDKTGSNLAQVCAYLLKNAYDQKGNRKQIAAASSQARSTARLLSILPFGLIVFLRFAAPDFAYPLFYTTSGMVVLGIVVAMIYTGNQLVEKMISNIG